MNHPYFAGQVVEDHRADLIEQARRHRLLRDTGAHDDVVTAARAPRPRAAGLRPRRSPLALLNLLIAAIALAVGIVAIATDGDASRPAPTVVTRVDDNAPVDARPVNDDVTGADEPRQAGAPATGIPAGDCTLRRVIVRC
jgi:hypothetical protein